MLSRQSLAGLRAIIYGYQTSAAATAGLATCGCSYSTQSKTGSTIDFGFKDVPRESKASMVAQVFSSVAPSYDIMNDLMSGGLHRLWKDHLVAALHPFPGMHHLDVAGGTGDVAFRVLRAMRAREALDPAHRASSSPPSPTWPGPPGLQAHEAQAPSAHPQHQQQAASSGGDVHPGAASAPSTFPTRPAVEAQGSGSSSGSTPGSHSASTAEARAAQVPTPASEPADPTAIFLRPGSRPGTRGAQRASSWSPGSVTVCDINPAMLAEGQKKAAAAADLAGDIGLRFVEGNAEALSQFSDNFFDAYTIAFGIRNVTDRPAALREAFRVLKPGGLFLCLEFSQVSQPQLRQAYDAYSFAVIPRIGGLVAGDAASYQYLVESIRQFPDQDTFADMIEDAGFKAVGYENILGGVVALHSGYKLPCRH